MLVRSRMIHLKDSQPDGSDEGFSLIELAVVLSMACVLSAIALPVMLSQRRLTRSTAVTREISTQIRYARQLAMSQRRAFTFQYDDSDKTVRVIGPIPVGTVALADPAYPNNTGSSVVATAPLTQGGLPASEISYGIPTASDLPFGAPTIPTGALADGVTRTNLSSNKVNITFQPDGSVIDAGEGLVNRGLFFFNNRAAQATASAISVLGASGRVKMWRYTTNGNKYAE